MIVKRILDHVIKFKEKIFLDSKKQLLIYIRVEKGIRKSRVVKAIKIGFILLSKKKKLVVSTLTSSTANSIDGSIVYITLRVNN